MNTLNQLLRAIITNPEADDPRLQYADLLQESGEEQWAGFIREQVRRATYERTDGYTRTPKTMEIELWQGLLPKFNLPSNWLVSFRIDDTGEWGTDRGVVIHRGFATRMHCPAADFLQYADALIWHPKQEILIAREVDQSAGGTHRFKVRAPRPCPDTAQPITKVVLTDLPTAEVRDFNALRSWKKPLEWGGDLRDSFKAEWPGIEFTFPEAYTTHW